MKILFIAPHPFFQERGTPIAVDLVLRVLSERGAQIDLITYAEGSDIAYPGLRHYRAGALPFLKGIRPGFSWKKLVASFLVMVRAFRLARKGKYDLVHAVEEGAFIALLLKTLFRVPYIYDMDSSLAQQMVEKKPFLGPAAPILEAFEGLAIRNSRMVLPVCRALADVAHKQAGAKVRLLHDVSLLSEGAPARSVESIRETRGVTGPLLLYVGNMEKYQGIDLLVEGFALAGKEGIAGDLVLIGGNAADTAYYGAKCAALGVGDRVHILGPRPVSDIKAYLDQADVLVSPRTKGRNTPMKVYSYLHSGKAVLATRIESHTQVMDDSNSMLVEPTPESMRDGIRRLAAGPEERARLGAAGRALIERDYSFPAFRAKLNQYYDEVSRDIQGT